MNLSGFSITSPICHLIHFFVLVFRCENLDTSYFYTFQVLFECFFLLHSNLPKWLNFLTRVFTILISSLWFGLTFALGTFHSALSLNYTSSSGVFGKITQEEKNMGDGLTVHEQ